MRLPEFSGLGICSLLICAFAKIAQDKWANVSDLLRSLRTNERLWGNCLDRSWQMSLMTNEWMWAIRSGHSGQMSELIGFLSKSITFIFRSQKISDWLKKKIFLIIFFVRFLQYFLKSKRFAHSFWAKWANRSGCSGQMSDCKRFAQVAQKEWAIVSKLLRSLTKKWANERITHFLSKLLICSLFWQKTSDSLQNSMSEFPTLWIWGSWKFVYITHTIKKLLGKEKKKF